MSKKGDSLFKAGNEFWKYRSKHGAGKAFEEPELLWEAACEYFQWQVDNPLISVEYLGKNAVEKNVPKMRAFTIVGLCSFLDCSSSWFRVFKWNLENDKVKDTPERIAAFLDTINRIEDVLYRQKFEGAAAGLLNQVIISRDLGLTEKQDIKSEGLLKIDGPVEVLVKNSGVPLAGSEAEVDLKR